MKFSEFQVYAEIEYEILGMGKEYENPGILVFTPNQVKCDQGKQRPQHYALSNSH